jgi:hypothetical protein
MKARALLIAGSIAGAILLAAPAAAQGLSTRPPAMCTAIQIVAYPAKTEPGPKGGTGVTSRGRKPTFSATKVADLEFRIVIPGTRDLAELYQLRLYTPTGHLYQAVDIPVDLTGGHAPSTRSLPGYPLPVPAASPEPADGALQVTTRVPLGGTLVSTASLYGKWRAEVWPKDAEAPCATEVFIVQP